VIGAHFSAAFIAHLEATLDDEHEKNALCEPVLRMATLLQAAGAQHGRGSAFSARGAMSLP